MKDSRKFQMHWNNYRYRKETDGIVIEYSPYEYGPYASGYIGVEIPYEALNINL